jgi:hypothetical protein
VETIILSFPIWEEELRAGSKMTEDEGNGPALPKLLQMVF